MTLWDFADKHSVDILVILVIFAGPMLGGLILLIREIKRPRS